MRESLYCEGAINCSKTEGKWLMGIVHKVFVVLLNNNGLQHLDDGYISLEWQSYPNYEILRVDNGFGDNPISSENHHQISIPNGVTNEFLVLSERIWINYKQRAYIQFCHFKSPKVECALVEYYVVNSKYYSV